MRLGLAWFQRLTRGVLIGLCLALAACSHLPERASSTEPLYARSLLVTPATNVDWTPLLWPGKQNVPFVGAEYKGRKSLRVNANRSMSILRQLFENNELRAGQLRFSWLVDGLLQHADIGVSGQDDAPVRIVLAFDGDRSKLPAKFRMQSELSRALLGEDMPYATLTYVWCNTRPVGTVLVSPRTDRVRKIVVESGPSRVGQWLDYQRDVEADFQRAFGEAPGALIGIALMTDADNTGDQINAWYGPLSLSAR